MNGPLSNGELMSAIAYMEPVIRSTIYGRTTFFDTSDFPWVNTIESKWKVVRKELDDRLERIQEIPNFQDIQSEQAELTNDNRWKTYVLYAYGQRVERNCQECPDTARLVEDIPGMKTAMFSILDGPKYIPHHRGPYNGVLRYHLGVKVPGPSRYCGIQVGPDTRSWTEGKSLIFDDTHSHRAWNYTDDIRVVLFVDFLRPLPPALDQANRYIVDNISVSSFITEAENNLNRWHQQVDDGFRS